jgi:hypothetical protein
VVSHECRVCRELAYAIDDAFLIACHHRHAYGQAPPRRRGAGAGGEHEKFAQNTWRDAPQILGNLSQMNSLNCSPYQFEVMSGMISRLGSWLIDTCARLESFFLAPHW